jgi:hypothetical protein
MAPTPKRSPPGSGLIKRYVGASAGCPNTLVPRLCLGMFFRGSASQNQRQSRKTGMPRQRQGGRQRGTSATGPVGFRWRFTPPTLVQDWTEISPPPRAYAVRPYKIDITDRFFVVRCSSFRTQSWLLPLTNLPPPGESSNATLWQRYEDWLYYHEGLGLYLDISRMGFDDALVES